MTPTPTLPHGLIRALLCTMTVSPDRTILAGDGIEVGRLHAAGDARAFRWAGMRRLIEYVAIEAAKDPNRWPRLEFDSARAMTTKYGFGGTAKHGRIYWDTILNTGASHLTLGGARFDLWKVQRQKGRIVLSPSELLLPDFAQYLPKGHPDARTVPAFDLRCLPSASGSSMLVIQEIHLFDRLRLALDEEDTVSGLGWTFGTRLSETQAKLVIRSWEAAGIVRTHGPKITLTRQTPPIPKRGKP